MTVVETYGYDGVDVDWESGFDATEMKWLLAALRNRLGSRILTADAVAGSPQAVYWADLHYYVDRVNIMTYDLGGYWDPFSWFNAALSGPPDNSVWSVELAVARFMDAGTPASKLNIGIPFYGYIYSGGTITGPRETYTQPLPSRRQIKYSEISGDYDVSSATYDITARVPWLATTEGWINFENAQSVTEKVSYAQRNGLGGFIIWALDSDYNPNARVAHPLLNAVQQALSPAKTK
jgi:chitinase